jgi:hypothetical protein
MYQKFTPENADEYCFVMEKKRATAQQLSPKKETLALIMQFACIYHVEKKLPARLSGIFLN